MENCINKAGNRDIRPDNSDLISLAPSWMLVAAVTNIWLLPLFFFSHSVMKDRGLKCKFLKSTLRITKIACRPSVFHITIKQKVKINS